MMFLLLQAVTVIVTGAAVWWLSFASDEQKAGVEETLSPITNALGSLTDAFRERISGEFIDTNKTKASGTKQILVCYR
jgi:hypothetical protein